MRRRRAGRGEVRKVLLAGHDLAGFLDPILAERALQPAHDRTFHAQSGIAPVILVLPMPGPLLCQTKSADVADTAVDDHLLAVIAVVEAAEVGEGKAVEPDQLYAGVEHQ